MSFAKINIAVIDDEIGILQLLSLVFSRRGCSSVTTYSSGQDFFEVYNDNKVLAPDIVITDMQMPGIKGFEILAKALQYENFSQTLFIAFSAFITPHDIRWLKDIGFDQVIQKPFMVDDFINENEVELLIDTRDEIISKRNPYKGLFAAVHELSLLRLRSTVLVDTYIKKLIVSIGEG